MPWSGCRPIRRSSSSGRGTTKRSAAAIDYVSAGPVVPTPTKPGRPGTGLEYVHGRRPCLSPWPVWVTGGVTPASVAELAGAGARHFVVVRWLTEASDPRRPQIDCASRSTRPSRDPTSGRPPRQARTEAEAANSVARRRSVLVPESGWRRRGQGDPPRSVASTGGGTGPRRDRSRRLHPCPLRQTDGRCRPHLRDGHHHLRALGGMENRPTY